MATLGEIVQEQGYRGDPALGGGYDTPIVIDTSPLDNLARYSFLYNREMWQRREADMQDKAKQLANLSAYDLQAIPEESAQLRGLWNELYNYARANPNVLDYRNNPTGWMDYNKKRNEFEHVLESAKQRNLVWQKWQTDIAAEQNPDSQARLKKELADNIKSTNINIPLPAQQKYDVAPVTTEAGSRKVIDFTVIGDNSNTIRKVNTADFASIGAQADAKIFGLNELMNKEKTGTPEQQKAYAAQVAAGKFEPVISAQTYKEAMANLKKDGDGNYINVPQMVLDVWAQIDNYNKRVAQEKTIVSGLKDKFERPIFGGQSGLKESDYVDIDKENFSARDYLKMRILAQSEPLGYVTTTTPTDNKIQLKQIAAENERARLNRENQLAIAKLPYENAKIGTGKPNVVVDEARAFANDLLAKIDNATDANGNVDMTKAQITPIEWQMMGLGTVNEQTGKFEFDPKQVIDPTTQLKFDKVTKQIIVGTPQSSSFFGLIETPAETKYINYKQIANNKFHFSSVFTTDKEASQQLNNVAEGYGGVPAPPPIPAALPKVPMNSDANYYKSSDNVEEINGNKVKYKDGSMWEVAPDGTMTKIN